MRYETASAFRQALDERLKIERFKTRMSVGRLRKRVAFELLLRRFVTVAPDRWMLKGALALDYRLSAVTRPTMDVDLGRSDNLDAAMIDIAAVQSVEMDDFFSFAIERDRNLAENFEIVAVRFRVRSFLADRIFERFALDIGFSDSMSVSPDSLSTSNFLAFAGISQISVPVLPLAQHLAEKLHAFTQTYGITHRQSSRAKDLVDILLITDNQAIDAMALIDAIRRTFAERNSHDAPKRLPPPPRGWADRYGTLADEVGVERDLQLAFKRASEFFDPVLNNTARGRWNRSDRRWYD